MKIIPLTKGEFAVVDDADYEWLSKFRWSCQKGYAVRTLYTAGRIKTQFMHRLIMNPPEGVQIDHRNCCKRDNQRANLRIATPQQNGANRGKNARNTSGFKGVSWHKGSKKWKAQIKVNGADKHLGYFSDPQSASAAYECSTKEHNGEFARA